MRVYDKQYQLSMTQPNNWYFNNNSRELSTRSDLYLHNVY